MLASWLVCSANSIGFIEVIEPNGNWLPLFSNNRAMEGATSLLCRLKGFGNLDKTLKIYHALNLARSNWELKAFRDLIVGKLDFSVKL